MGAKKRVLSGQVSPTVEAKFDEFVSARNLSMSKALNAALEEFFGIAPSDSQVNHNELLATEVESLKTELENLKEEHQALEKNLPEQITTLVTEQITPIVQDVKSLKNNESQRKLQSESIQLPQLPTIKIVPPKAEDIPPASSDLPVNQNASLTSSQEYPSVDESNSPVTVEDALETASNDTKDESPIQETRDAIESSNTSVEINSEVATTILKPLVKHIIKELKRCKNKYQLNLLGSRYPDEVKKIVWRYVPEKERKRLSDIVNENLFKTANSN